MADDFLDEAEVAPGAPATAAPEPAPATPSEPVAAAQPEAAPVAPPPVQPVTASADMVPLSVLLDERDKRQAAAREAAELRAWRADQERKRQEAAAQIPHPLDDPEGFAAYWENKHRATERGFEQRLTTAVIQERIANSEDKWRDKLGDEEFEKLHAWSATMGPQWVQNAERQRDPFGFAHKEYDKQQKAKRAEEFQQKLGGKDLDAYIEEQIAARLATAQAPAPVEAPAQPGQPRRADGTFAPAPSPTRRSAPSLAVVGGAAPASAPVNDSAYFEDEFRKG